LLRVLIGALDAVLLMTLSFLCITPSGVAKNGPPNRSQDVSRFFLVSWSTREMTDVSSGTHRAAEQAADRRYVARVEQTGPELL
jgi:hypothetical protein